MLRTVIVTLVSSAALLSMPPHAAAAPQQVWRYGDPTGDAKPAVDVVGTSLDIKKKGFFRVRVFGAEFIQDETDMIRVFFDTDPDNNGPDYVFDWYFGKNPARKVGATILTEADSWGAFGNSVKCPRLRRSVNYKADIITIAVPRSCLGKPDAVRWAGFTGRIARVDKKKTMYGEWDDFPALRQFPNEWAA